MPAELRFPVMGSRAHVMTVGGPVELPDVGRRRLEQLEARWSRFRPGSEIARLNGLPGRPVAVSADTYVLVARAVAAWKLTGGRFDPTVHDAMLANGYDRSFEDLATVDRPARGDERTGDRPRPAPGCAGVRLLAGCPAVWLPPGVRLDPGGIGKGLAADLIAAELMAAGAEGVMVDVGGDVRVAGSPPEGGQWVVAVQDPFEADRALLSLGLADGAVATSSRLRRRWLRGGRAVHHLLDPATGQPTAGRLVAATVVAAEGWWAEALTKAVLVDDDLDRLRNASAVAVAADGTRLATADLEVLIP